MNGTGSACAAHASVRHEGGFKCIYHGIVVADTLPCERTVRCIERVIDVVREVHVIEAATGKNDPPSPPESLLAGFSRLHLGPLPMARGACVQQLLQIPSQYSPFCKAFHGFVPRMYLSLMSLPTAALCFVRPCSRKGAAARNVVGARPHRGWS